MSEQPGSGQTGQPGTGTAPAGGEWHAGIADAELRGYVQTKGWKDPASLADSYRNLEKLQGVPQDRLLKLPEKPDDPAWDTVHTKLGRPEKPELYELKGDEAMVKRMSAAMHKAGVPKSAAQALNAEWDAYVNELIATDTAERQQKDAADLAALRGEWGGDFEKNSELGRRAGREFGLSAEQFNAISGALGSGATLKLFAAIGGKLGEAGPFDPNGSGGNGGFGMTKEAAQARITALKADKDWTASYLNGDAAKRAEMDRLHTIAAGG